MTTQAKTFHYWQLAACFTLSGFSSLIYESIWTRYLQLFIGSGSQAQVVTLVIFMGGMAAGAWGAARLSANFANPLLWYALVEAVVGVMAAAFHYIYAAATGASYDIFFPALGYSPAAVQLTQWLIAGLLVLPQSVLLGATFPLMASGVIRLFPARPGRTLSIFYFANSLGGAAGVLVSGFYLVETAGLPGAMTAGGVITLIAAGGTFIAAKTAGVSAGKTAAMEPATNGAAADSGRLLLFSALTGAASFMYEIGWIRMLTFVLDSSSHSFELMLSAFILGLALGGLFIRNRIERVENHIYALAVIQVAMGAMALATIHVYGASFWAMARLATQLRGTGWDYFLYSGFRQVIAMGVMLPATILAGMTLPLVTHHLYRRGRLEASIGQVYAANTVGAIAGIILASQVVMTQLGLRYVVIAGAALDIAAGIWLFSMAKSAGPVPGRRFFAWLCAGAFALAIAGIFSHPLSVSYSYAKTWRYSTSVENVTFHQNGTTATVDVYLTPGENPYWTLNENALPQTYIGVTAPKDDEVTNTLLAAITWDANPSITTVAAVGLGSGLSASIMLDIPNIKKLDVVEIEPAMVEGARHMGPRTARVHQDPRCQIHIDDARSYFASSGRKYDLIISEPSHIWVSGVAGLFTTEFYSMARRSLNAGGMLAQWMHLHDQTPELVASVMAAISENFEDYQAYLTWDGNLLILAKKGIAVGQPTGEVFKFPQMKERLRWIGVESTADFAIRWLGGKKALDPFFRSFKPQINSDYYPALSFGAIQARFFEKEAFGLGRLRGSPALVNEGLEKIALAGLENRAGPNNYLHGAAAARMAYDFYSALADNDLSGSELTQDMAELAGRVRSIEAGCPERAEAKAWVSSLNKAAFLLLPYTAPPRLNAIWEGYLASSCVNEIPGARQWLLLHQAMTNRDFRLAGREAAGLLPSGSLQYTQENIYLVSVTALGLIHDGKGAEALDVLNRLEEGKYNESNYHLRLLAASAGELAGKRK